MYSSFNPFKFHLSFNIICLLIRFLILLIKHFRIGFIYCVLLYVYIFFKGNNLKLLVIFCYFKNTCRCIYHQIHLKKLVGEGVPETHDFFLELFMCVKAYHCAILNGMHAYVQDRFYWCTAELSLIFFTMRNIGIQHNSENNFVDFFKMHFYGY